MFQINPTETTSKNELEAWKSSLGIGNIQDLMFKQDFNDNLNKGLDENFEKVNYNNQASLLFCGKRGDLKSVK